MANRRKHIKKKIHAIKPKKSIFKRAVFWYAVLLFIIILAVFYFLLFLPEIQIKNIEISGNEKVDKSSIKEVSESIINKKIIGFYKWSLATKSIFLANLQNINNNILNKFPQIDSVEIKKEFPETLTLKVKERIPVAVFCQSGAIEKCFFIDEKGVIFEELPAVQQGMFIVQQTLNVKNVFVGENVIDKNAMEAILKIEKTLKDNFQINILSALISAPSKLDITTVAPQDGVPPSGKNWRIYFDLNSNIGLQAVKMDLLLKNEISPDARKKLQYIDLRFDRAYYK